MRILGHKWGALFIDDSNNMLLEECDTAADAKRHLASMPTAFSAVAVVKVTLANVEGLREAEPQLYKRFSSFTLREKVNKKP
jgi:hypothetical protein